MNLIPSSLKRAGDLRAFFWNTVTGWGGKTGSHRWCRLDVKPGVDKLLIYTVFLQRELLGSRVKPGCTPTVIQDRLYNWEIKTTLQSRGANQADYIGMSLISSDGTVPLHAKFGVGSEMWFSSKWANTTINWNSSIPNLICGLVHTYLFKQSVTSPVQWTESISVLSSIFYSFKN